MARDSYSNPTKAPKTATDKSIGKNRYPHRWFEPIALEFRDIFKKKTAENLASRAGRDVRVAEIWLSGKGAPSGGALARLILSDVGDRVIAALTRDSRQPWAKRHRDMQELADLNSQLNAITRRARELREEI